MSDYCEKKENEWIKNLIKNLKNYFFKLSEKFAEKNIFSCRKDNIIQYVYIFNRYNQDSCNEV